MDTCDAVDLIVALVAKVVEILGSPLSARGC